MGKVRQLADLFLRGALANETMKHLTPRQKQVAERVCNRVMSHEALTGHKHTFMIKLGTTIKCDYTDRLMAQQEYRITIWRAVIYLLYHREYSYRCVACNATSYQSQRGAPIKFDRRWDCCPACKQYTIDKPGESGLEAGSFITSTGFEALLLELTRAGRKPPTVYSCIEPIPGKKKVANPSQILNDPAQVKKFFGEFIWNYFRQSIKENKIVHHGRQTRRLTGPVDIVAVRSITQLLKVNKTNYQCDIYCPVDGYYVIYCHPYALDPDLVLELLELKAFVESYGGEVKVDDGSGQSYLDNAILIKDLYGNAPIVDLDIAINEQVQVVTNSVPKDDDDEPDIVQQLGKPDMPYDMQQVEQDDTISALRESLPEGDCRTILDLITNQGEAYERFTQMYPNDVMANNGVPRQNRMAEFLGVSQKQIRTHRDIIQVQAIAHGIGQ